MEMRRRTSGFTLVELVLIVVILSIVALLIPITFSASVRSRSTADLATKFYLTLKRAKATSIMNGTRVRMNIDQSARTYYLESVSDTLTAPDTFNALDTDVETYDDSVNVSASGNDDYPTFLPDGTAGDFTIEVSTLDGSEPYTIIVEGASGKITLEQPAQ